MNVQTDVGTTKSLGIIATSQRPTGMGADRDEEHGLVKLRQIKKGERAGKTDRKFQSGDVYLGNPIVSNSMECYVHSKRTEKPIILTTTSTEKLFPLN